jgi:O-methyltransferase involved in polyketide biosynthesis
VVTVESVDDPEDETHDAAGDGADAPVDPALEGVPETLLWNLYQRASEARHPATVLKDPTAVALVDRLDYPFRERFGDGELGQWQALRAATFDQAVRTFAAAHPGGLVVALGEGLETQFWRVDDGAVRWLTVDLPEVVALRTRLLPEESDRQHVVAASVLDPRWMDEADRLGAEEVLVTAQGLLMYLAPPEVHALLAEVAARFPGGSMVLDGVPAWFSKRTVAGQMRTRQGYVTPPMPWALDGAERHRLRGLSPAITRVRDLLPPRGRGILYESVLPLLARVPAARHRGLAGLPVVQLDFRARPAGPAAPPRTP